MWYGEELKEVQTINSLSPERRSSRCMTFGQFTKERIGVINLENQFLPKPVIVIEKLRPPTKKKSFVCYI